MKKKLSKKEVAVILRLLEIQRQFNLDMAKTILTQLRVR